MVSLLRQHVIRVIIFIDDTLVMAQRQEDLLIMTKEIITLLHLLGFSKNWDKLAQIPSQEIQFLGFVVNSVTMIMSLPKCLGR